MLFIFSMILTSFLATEISSQESCLTVENKSGSCIKIENCPPIFDILKRPRPLSYESLEFLRSAQCGFDGNSPKVCCEIQETITTPTTIESTTIDETILVATAPAPPDVLGHPNLRLLDHDICGPITEGKIFGGNKTGVLEFPWMALIAYRINDKHEFRCGGSVINKRYVLTAAHCVTQLPAALVLSGVRLGDHDIDKEIDCDKDEDDLEIVCAERYQDFGIDRFHFHPNYTRTDLQNDIALVRLNRDADFRPASVRPICLPIGSAATISQRKVVVTGWGATETGPRSQDLLQVFLNLVPNDQCATIYQQNVIIGYKQICAGGEKNTDSCFGDSGGPLQSPSLYNNNPKYVQHGIVSFGPKKCGMEGIPGVYTRLIYYLDWILDTMTD